MVGNGGRPEAGWSAGPGADAYDAVVARAKALIPELRERASRTEELRRLPPETERDLHDAGLFRILQPKRVGGPNSTMSHWSTSPTCSGRPMLPSPGISRTLRAITGCWACLIGRRRRLSGMKTADALIASSFVFPAGRARKVGRRICSARTLGVFLRSRFRAIGICLRALCHRTMTPTASNTGSF